MAAELHDIFNSDDPDELIDRALKLLDDGAVVVTPTETVYGAAGRLDRPAAVERLRRLRGPSAKGPFTLHVAGEAQAMTYLGEVGELGRRLMQKLWPGPVSLAFDVNEARREEIAARVGLPASDLFAPDGTITLRCPDHFVATQLLWRVPGPVAMIKIGVVSNDEPFPPQRIAELGEDVAMVLNAGPTKYSKPSTMLRVRDGKYQIVRAGVFDARIIERQLMTRLLFICSGNTCRSPMAAALARRAIAERLGVPPDQIERHGYDVISAGTFAVPGLRATPQAVEAVTQLGADLHAHRSRPLAQELIHSADHIFVMGRSHAQTVASMSPGAASRVSLLDPDGDVEDPIGGDVTLYSDLAKHFVSLIDAQLTKTVFADLRSSAPSVPSSTGTETRE